MAKSASKSGIAKKAPAMDIFAAATEKVKSEPKKAPGTVIQLPKELDPTTGKLTEECQRMHDAVAEVMRTKEEEDNAKNKGNLAKGLLNPYILGQYVSRIVAVGMLPTSPVVLVDHAGQSLTYVVADKAGMYALTDEQLEMLTEMLGADVVARITYTSKEYTFVEEVMNEITGEVPVGLTAEEIADLPRVHNIVSKHLNEALVASVESGELTIEQAQSLLKAKMATKLKKGEFARIAQHAGPDHARIQGTIEALGSTVGRYLKP